MKGIFFLFKKINPLYTYLFVVAYLNQVYKSSDFFKNDFLVSNFFVDFIFKKKSLNPQQKLQKFGNHAKIYIIFFKKERKKDVSHGGKIPPKKVTIGHQNELSNNIL